MFILFKAKNDKTEQAIERLNAAAVTLDLKVKAEFIKMRLKTVKILRFR